MTTTETHHSYEAPVWTLGERLEKAREHAGLSRDEMAHRLDVSERTIRNYENESVRITRAIVIAYSAETLVPLDWFDAEFTTRSRCFRPPGQMALPLDLEFAVAA